MPSRLIPLFPLQVVVFPRAPLPLHIFEERYKEMVGKAIRDDSEFGIVLAKEDGIVNAGCTVTVEKVIHHYPDGRLDILTRGLRRFEIQSLNEEQSYLQAEVSFFDDEDFAPPPGEVRDEALTHYKELSEFATGGPREELNPADPQLSFQVARGLPDLDFLSALLRQRSETSRLKQLNRYLAEYIPKRRTIEHVKEIAPTNGFGGKHAGI